ncbi:hypothetical protein C8J56DRAFT_1042205 [Mycena floridula]|nr:hypothetical protein C8J56DRAFT_1042205 [Mycena floridula]
MAQINACRQVFPEATILLCHWHVLHAWQGRFCIIDHEKLWELLKKLVHLQDSTEFSAMWSEIQILAPKDLLAYLQVYWMGSNFLPMWSSVYRSEFSIFEASNTNMLVEAWHNVLKGKFLQGKWNRRMDFLIYILMEDTIPHFRLCEHRQEAGFEGEDMEEERRKEIIATCERQFKMEDIEVEENEDGNTIYVVQSKSCSDRCYEIDISLYTCSCFSFPAINFCKHICVVQKFYPETIITCPIAEPDVYQVPDTCQSLSPSPSPIVAPLLLLSSRLTDDSLSSSNHDISNICERLSLLLSRFQGLQPSQYLDISGLSKEVDYILDSTSTLMPPRQKLPPHIKTSTETAQTMPQIKRKRKKQSDNMDPAYGGGESSGNKATELPKAVKRMKKTASTFPASQPASFLPPMAMAPFPSQPMNSSASQEQYPSYLPISSSLLAMVLPRPKLTGDNVCPNCGRHLVPQISKEGIHANHPFISCFNSYMNCHHFHAFSMGETEEAIASGWTLPTPKKQKACQKSKVTKRKARNKAADLEVPIAKERKLCRFCGNNWANEKCTFGSCAGCCRDKLLGYCKVALHQADSSTISQPTSIACSLTNCSQPSIAHSLMTPPPPSSSPQASNHDSLASFPLPPSR